MWEWKRSKERLGSCYSPSPPSVPVVVVFKLLDSDTFCWDRKLALWKIFIFLFFELCLRHCWPEEIRGSLPPFPSQLMAGLSMLCPDYRKDPEENKVNPLFVLTTLGDRPGAALWLGSHQGIPVALAFLLDCGLLGNDANPLSQVVLSLIVVWKDFLFFSPTNCTRRWNSTYGRECFSNCVELSVFRVK